MSQASTGTPDTMHYLTLQDMLWINLQVTKKVNSFDYDRLEEAVFYQYAYGKSLDVLKQAGSFVGGFLRKEPFASGNIGTAFVGCLAFLLLNGYEFTLDDSQGVAWIDGIAMSQNADAAVRELAKASGGHHELTLEEAVPLVLERYPNTVAALASKE